MPEDLNAVFIMVATGTGIAPYRAFWRRQFLEDVPNYTCVMCRVSGISGTSTFRCLAFWRRQFLEGVPKHKCAFFRVQGLWGI